MGDTLHLPHGRNVSTRAWVDDRRLQEPLHPPVRPLVHVLRGDPPEPRRHRPFLSLHEIEQSSSLRLLAAAGFKVLWFFLGIEQASLCGLPADVVPLQTNAATSSSCCWRRIACRNAASRSDLSILLLIESTTGKRCIIGPSGPPKSPSPCNSRTNTASREASLSAASRCWIRMSRLARHASRAALVGL